MAALAPNRFCVTVCNDAGAIAERDENCGFEVNLLNSLPWNRSGGGPSGFLDSQSAAVTDDAEFADAAEDPTGTLTAAQGDNGCAISAKLAKSLSHLRLSASGSSANLRSFDSNCCRMSGTSSICKPQEQQEDDQSDDDEEDCNNEGTENVEVDAQLPESHDFVPGVDEAQHLGIPWSACSSTRRTCSQRSQSSRDPLARSAVSWHQLAAAHRSEKVSNRCFHRKTSLALSLATYDCVLGQQQEQQDQQDFHEQLQERVRLWLSQTMDPSELDCGANEQGRTGAGATFFLGNQDT